MARRIWIVCLSLALAGTSLPAWAQDGLLEDLYGRGVHAFFERRYEEAHDLLTKAIGSGLKDPRAHYFQGLTYLRLGRPDEANVEFTTGATLEAMAAEPINVGKAIERIQGAERLAIERHRRTARVAVFNRAEAIAKARYEERQEAEKRVLLPPRGRRPAGGAAPPPAAEGAEETDPFGARRPAPLPAAPTDAKPTTPPPPPPAEGVPAKPVEPKPVEPKPAEPAAEETKPAAAAEAPRGSVFGALFRAVKNSVPGDASAAGGGPDVVVPAGDPNAPDPFGAPAKPKPPAAKPAPKPAVDPAAKPAADNDPFAK